MFIEEPARADFVKSSHEIKKNIRVALATGENENDVKIINNFCF